MKGSLGLRLSLAAAVFTFVAILGTSIVLNLLFRAYFEEQVRDELTSYLTVLTGNIGTNQDGAVDIVPLTDARFSEALSGYYWQIQVGEAEPILSPSLWAAPLNIFRPQAPGTIFFADHETGAGEHVATSSWLVKLGDSDVLVAVALDRSKLDRSVDGFAANSLLWLAVLGLFFLGASLVWIRIGLKPLENIRGEINHVTRNPGDRMPDSFPAEVLPLVKEINSFLDSQQNSIEEARLRASSLAHGLKTPMTILQGLAYDIRADGDNARAEAIEAEIESMQHIVERELARVRSSQSVLRTSAVLPNVEKLKKALGQTERGQQIEWGIELPDSLKAPFDEFDLTELLGNLLDNAVKWAESRINVTGGTSDGKSFLRIEDDGPGVTEDMLESVLETGRRLDPDRPGAGIGLTIVHDMTKAHDCTLVLGRGVLGGLSVEISWSENFRRPLPGNHS